MENYTSYKSRSIGDFEFQAVEEHDLDHIEGWAVRLGLTSYGRKYLTVFEERAHQRKISGTQWQFPSVSKNPKDLKKEERKTLRGFFAYSPCAKQAYEFGKNSLPSMI